MIEAVHILTLTMLFALLMPRRRAWIAVAAAAALIVVLTATPIEMRFWSAVGVPSITSLALLCDFAVRRLGWSLMPSPDRGLLFSIAAAAFVLIEPAALGYVPLDLYSAGFSPLAPLVISVAAAIFLAQRSPGTACVIVVALLALDVRLLHSANAWDYFVDPIVGLASLGWLAVRIGRRVVPALR